MMLRSAFLASLIALGATGAALAQEGPVLVGGGGDGGPRVVYSAPSSNTVVGGAQVTLSGGDRDRSYDYGAVNSIPGQVGTVVGGLADGGPRVIYTPQQESGGLASLGVGAPRS
jgi:hypothetical protein